MPAPLYRNDQIPALAEQVTPEMLGVLRRIQKAGFILNGRQVDPATVDVLKRLTALYLVDPGYEGDARERPYLWSSNGNGVRVLNYKTGIRAGPYYEIPSTQLAAWLERQGPERWWNVDGDPLLTGRLPFPCPADERAAELVKIDRPLLVQAKKEDRGAVGQVIAADKLNDLVERLAENIHLLGDEPMPPWSGDRVLYLCWKGTTEDWLLTEDSETAEQMRAEESAKGTDTAEATKE
jgi:hypothetical protein